MIIELAGLPATGKTTTAERLSQELGLPVIRMHRYSRLLFGLLFILINPRASYHLRQLLVQGSVENVDLKRKLLHNAFFGACATHQRAVFGGGIIDQGLAHTVIAALPKSYTKIESLIRLLPLGDLVIFCSSSDEVRTRRMRERTTRTRSFSTKEADRWEHESGPAAELVRLVLGKVGIPVLDLNTDTPTTLHSIRSLLPHEYGIVKFFGYYIAWILSLIFPVRRGAAVLMYHSVAPHSWKHAIDPALFECQMQFLSKKSRLVTLEQVVGYADGRINLQDGSVAVTFDDGYADFMNKVLPVIRKYRIPITLFLTTNLNEQTSPVGLSRITVDDLRLLSSEPLVSIESHGVTHRKYTELTPEQIQAEFEESARHIEQFTGKFPRYFAYPYGARSSSVEALVNASSYEAACAITEGFVYPGDTITKLKRIQIDRTMSFALFKLRLTSALILHRTIVDWFRNIWRT